MDKEKEQDLEELLDLVVWGHRVVEIPIEEDKDQTLVFRPLTLEERNIGNYLYQKALRGQIKSGSQTREGLKKDAIKHGLWEKAYDKDIETMREEFTKITEELTLAEKKNKHRRSPTTKLKRLRKRIVSIAETVRTLEGNHAQYIEIPSAEHSAEQERGMYFLQCSTLTFPEMEPLWSTFKDLKNEIQTIFVGQLMRLFYNATLLEERDVRRVARSGYWRAKWLGAKKNRGVKTLFNNEMYDLTVDQFRLMYWSQIYDSAFESMESPSDDVIDDDKLFDRWLDEQHQKRKQERKKSAFDQKVKHLTKDGHEIGMNVQGEYCQECTCGVKQEAEARGAEKLGHAHNPDCSYGVYLYYDEERKLQRVEEVQSANPERMRKILGSESKRLAEIGPEGIEEQLLRGNKTRSAFGMDTKYHGPSDLKGKQGRARPQ